MRYAVPTSHMCVYFQMSTPLRRSNRSASKVASQRVSAMLTPTSKTAASPKPTSRADPKGPTGQGRQVSIAEGLAGHVYISPNKSIMERLFLSAFWQGLAEYYPDWLAPNVITLTGFVVVLIPWVLLVQMDPHVDGGETPSWWYFLAAFSVFFYQTMDGTHAEDPHGAHDPENPDSPDITWRAKHSLANPHASSRQTDPLKRTLLRTQTLTHAHTHGHAPTDTHIHPSTISRE